MEQPETRTIDVSTESYREAFQIASKASENLAETLKKEPGVLTTIAEDEEMMRVLRDIPEKRAAELNKQQGQWGSVLKNAVKFSLSEQKEMCLRNGLAKHVFECSEVLNATTMREQVFRGLSALLHVGVIEKEAYIILAEIFHQRTE